MLDAINQICMTLASPLLDWLLYLPRDITLVLVAIFTGLILILIRRACTNQQLLRRCKADKRCLKTMIRQAKKKKDKQNLARFRSTISQIDRKLLTAEPKPLLISIVPIAILAVWCFARIAYLPVDPGQPVTVKVYYPASGIGDLTYLLPQDGMSVENYLIQKVAEDRVEGAPLNGIAIWRLTFEQRDEPYSLTVRYHSEPYEIKVSVDGKKYAQPLMFYDSSNVIASEVVLREYKPFGVIPAVNSLMLQPWIVGYLVFVIPLSLLFKKFFHVY